MQHTKLKEIRERHHLSQLEMGEILHLSQSGYQKLENGNSTLRSDQIVLLIKQFGDGAKDLLENDGIEIVFKDNAVSSGTFNGKAQVVNIHNFPVEKLDTILDELNSLKSQITKS